MLSPARVVVPNPSVETDRRFLVDEPTAKPMGSPPRVWTASLAVGVDVPIPTKPVLPIIVRAAIDEVAVPVTVVVPR